MVFAALQQYRPVAAVRRSAPALARFWHTRCASSRKSKNMSGDFSSEQKRYLEGFVAGLQIAKTARAQGGVSAATAEPSGPDAAHLQAQDRIVKAGGKLSDQEKFKRELHTFDGYERLQAQAAHNEDPKPPGDVY